MTSIPNITTDSHIVSNPNINPVHLLQSNPQKNPSLCCQSCRLNKFCLSKDLNIEGSALLNSIAQHQKPAHKGDHFFRQNSRFSSLYIVRSGCVKIYQVDQSGDEHIVGFYMAGEIFGLDGMHDGQHHYSAKALDTTAVCEIPFHKLEQNFNSHSGLQVALISALNKEIHERQQPLLLLHRKPSEQRLATFLLDIASGYSNRGLSGTNFNLPMSRRDIAHYLGMTEETVSRLFSRFQSIEILSANRRDVQIRDIDKLQQMSITLH